MEKITTKTTTGKSITFNVDGDYYTQENISSHISDIFSSFKDMRYCVLYTKIVADKEYDYESKPYIDIKYKGLIGFQNMNFFKSKEDAEDDYNHRKVLVGDNCDYADVFLVEKNSGKIS